MLIRNKWKDIRKETDAQYINIIIFVNDLCYSFPKWVLHIYNSRTRSASAPTSYEIYLIDLKLRLKRNVSRIISWKTQLYADLSLQIWQNGFNLNPPYRVNAAEVLSTNRCHCLVQKNNIGKTLNRRVF